MDYFMYWRAILRTFQIAFDFYYVSVGGKGGAGEGGAGGGGGVGERGKESILYGYSWNFNCTPPPPRVQLKIFFGPNGTCSARSHFRTKKVSIFSLPLKWPELWICPSQNHYAPHHINNRCINSFKGATTVSACLLSISASSQPSQGS